MISLQDWEQDGNVHAHHFCLALSWKHQPLQWNNEGKDKYKGKEEIKLLTTESMIIYVENHIDSTKKILWLIVWQEHRLLGKTELYFHIRMIHDWTFTF